MDENAFREFVGQICTELETISVSNPTRISACRTGEDFEQCVVEAARAVIARMGISATLQYTAGSHVFPDIVIECSDGSKFGIEVKSSSSSSSRNWKINGNSVLGSTEKDVSDIYIIFGKTAIGNQGFRYKRYEDAIANVAVTHSPRYTIDMDLATGDTFFAKSGLSYKQIAESEDPIGLITTYFKSQGQRAWWLSESTPAAIRMFSELSSQEQATLLGYCFAHFPEVFSCSPQKYHRCAMWLVAERSVVSASLRDNFTAGGRVDLVLNGAHYDNIPRIFSNLRDYRFEFMKALEEATAEELCEDWSYSGHIEETNDSKRTTWISIAANFFTSQSVNNYNKVHLLSDLLME